MGFLKFLKKGEERREMASDHMDIPPPPQIGSFGTELPSFSGPQMGDRSLDIPSFDASPAIAELPEIKPFSYEEYEQRMNDSMPPARQMPEPIMPSMPAPSMRMPAMPTMPTPSLLKQPEIEYTPMHEKASWERETFIQASVYREILQDLDSTLSHKMDIENKSRDAKDNEYSKMADCLEDVQRKLMEIDSKLFEV